MKTLALIIFYFFIINLTYSQYNYSETELNEMLKTYSFYLGQLATINEIKENHPTYKLKTKSAQDLWNLNFQPSIKNIIAELNKNLGEKFEEYESELIANISMIDYSDVTSDDIEYTIETIKKRAKGEMPSPFLETLLSFNPTYQKSPEKEILDGFFNDYYTSESSKSNGLNIKIKYPKSWLAKNGDRPHVIKKITSDYGHGLESVLITIYKIEETLSESGIALLLSEDGLKEMFSDDFKIISINTGLTIDNLPSSSITYYHERNQMNLELGMIMETYLFYYKDFQISFVFSVGSTSENYSDILNRYEINKKLFWHIANDIVIISQYE